jgi:ABC-type multidrug transport system permease subunit
VLRGLSAVLYKELRQIRRDPASLFLALMVPVIQLAVFGYAIDTEVRDVPTLVVDASRTRASRAFTEALVATGTFRLVGEAADRDEALSRLRSGEARAAVFYPPELEERRLGGDPAPVQLLVDGSDSSLANQAQAAALGLAGELGRREGGSSAARRYDVRPRFLYNPDGRSERFFVPGLAAIIVQLVTMILTAFAIVRERERGTLEQLLVTPVSAGALTLGKIVPAVLVGAAEAVIVVVAMVALFDVPIAGSLALLGAVTVLYLFTSLALGLLISAFARTQLQAMMLTMAVLLPSVLLSGFMFPRASMPPGIYELTFALPATYFIEILRGIVLRGASAAELWHHVAPLLGIGAGLSVIVALVLRRARP